MGRGAWAQFESGRWYRPLMAGSALALLALAVFFGWLAWSIAAPIGRVGADLALYLDATSGWLAGGSFYPEHQLAGPYPITDGDILYPPTMIPFFMIFLVLPNFLFWLIPLSIVAWVVWRYRPAPWTWPLMALCLAYIPTTVKFVHYNPVMWAGAAVGLGLIYGWPSLFVLLKPSVAPFALVGVRHRSWWIGLPFFVVYSLLFAPLWIDFATALMNSHNGDGLLYSISDVPFLLIPIIAYLGRTRFRTRPIVEQPISAPAPAELAA
jgi:hypothetical protein